jgi:hypothetical protein
MIRAHHVHWIVLIILVQMTHGFAGETPSAAPDPEQLQAKSMVQLETQVDGLLASGDPVMIRRSIEDVFALVDRLLKSGQQDPLPSFPKMTSIRDNATTLVVVPVGDVDACVLGELQRVLHARLTIPVLVQETRVLIPPFPARSLCTLHNATVMELPVDCERSLPIFGPHGYWVNGGGRKRC